MSKKSNQTIIVGLDHGNGWVKARTSTNEIILPSYVSNVEDLGQGLVGKSLDTKEYESSYAKGDIFVWGKDVLKSKNVLSTYGTQDRYKQKHYNLLSQFALAEALSDRGSVVEDVWVITGVPSEEKGTSVETDLKEVLFGTHNLKINGENKIIHVTKVVILPQPVGTVMSLYLDQKGFVAEESFESANIGIIDVGTGTTDLDNINELRRLEDGTLSIPMGMFDVYRRIAKYIKKEHPALNITPQLVENQFESDTYVISERSSIDIADIKEKAIEDMAMKIKNSITQSWKTWESFDRIIITGGGASTVGEKLKELIGDAAVTENSQTANADGFYSYGEFLKGE